MPPVFGDGVVSQDGNGSGSVRMGYMDTQTRNPNIKPEPAPNSNSGQNSSPKLKPADTRNPSNNLKPDFFSKQVPATATSMTRQGAGGLYPLSLRHEGRGQPLGSGPPPCGAGCVRCLPACARGRHASRRRGRVGGEPTAGRGGAGRAASRRRARWPASGRGRGRPREREPPAGRCGAGAGQAARGWRLRVDGVRERQGKRD